LRNFRANRRYYAQVRDRLEALGITRLVLFLEGEPLERSILAWYRGKVELWEEGLSHYVDLTTPLWYAARGPCRSWPGSIPMARWCGGPTAAGCWCATVSAPATSRWPARCWPRRRIRFW
jgi:hypothetical protein